MKIFKRSNKEKALPARHWSTLLFNLILSSSSSLSLLLFLFLPDPINAAGLGMERREVPNARNVVVYNKSGRRIDVLWINRHTDPVSYQSNSENGEGYPYGASQGINSFIGHEFEIREMPSKKTGECKISGDCKTGYFQVNDQDGQKVTIDKEFNVFHEDDRTMALKEADDLLDSCENTIKEKWGNLDPMQLVDAITDCMEVKLNETLSKQEEERSFQSQLRERMGNELVPYACGDVNFTDATEIVNRSWTFDEQRGEGHRKFQLQVFHERPTSQIFRIQNFTTPEECEALKYFVSPDGSNIPFVTVNDMTKQGQIVHTLASKFYELSRIALRWPDLEFGEQYEKHHVELLDIHKDINGVSVLPTCTKHDLAGYDPSNPKSKPPDNCLLPGAPRPRVPTKHFTVEKPNEIASLFLFCNQDPTPSLGGIHFPDAAVHINREPNLLVMAVHRQLDDPLMDGYTTNYHFCPNYDILSHTFYAKENGNEKAPNGGGTAGAPAGARRNAAKDEL